MLCGSRIPKTGAGREIHGAVTPARGRWHYSAMSPVPLLSASPQLSLVECEDHDYPHLLAAATHRAAHKGQIQTVVSVGWTALIFHSPISPCFHILCIFPLSILNMKERIMREARQVMYHSFKSHQAEVQKTQSFFFPLLEGDFFNPRHKANTWGTVAPITFFFNQRWWKDVIFYKQIGRKSLNTPWEHV